MQTENILKTAFFENDDVTIITWFPCPSFDINPGKMTADRYVFKFLQRSVDLVWRKVLSLEQINIPYIEY